MQNTTYISIRYGGQFARALLLAGLSLAAMSAIAVEDIRLATTTSTENSGLLKFLLPKFEAGYGAKVRVISVGTGQAIKLGENGDADVVLVHARPAEDKFVVHGYGVNRRDVMYNDFVLVGPRQDPAAVRGMKDVVAAMRKISASGAKFISRGDDSGTHQMEIGYWKNAGITPRGAWYMSAGQGMGQVLTIAAELRAYTLTDRATYGAYRSRLGLEILVADDPRMFNPYGIIAVNPARHPDVNYAGAMALIEWITSLQGQTAIAEFKVNGEQLFFPNALK